MPEPSLRFVSYAVGASLAAVALIYVIAPPISSSTGPIGLKNRANDCFINSVLQALAGIPELREYLIRETHRRAIEPETYERLWPDVAAGTDTPTAGSKSANGSSKRLDWLVRSEQQGEVTSALKLMLDALNQKPPTKKSISPDMFIHAMERAFRLRVSRQQQDAHEFLQIVSQRLEEEYQAGHAARCQAETVMGGEDDDDEDDDDDGPAKTGPPAPAAPSPLPVVRVVDDDDDQTPPDERDVFPMRGAYQRQLTCKSCGFRTKPVEEAFTIMTVSVPQASSISLDECIRQHLVAEDIQDFRCARCRLEHCRDVLGARIERARARNRAQEAERLGAALARVDGAMERHDPDSLADVALPGDEGAPLRCITKTSRVSQYPAVLVLHLSRSVYSSVSHKNLARVSFGERLEMGSLAAPRPYRLLAVITHKGDHHSGHYETFRRQSTAAPYPNTNTFQPAGVYSRAASRVASRAASRAASPSRNALQKQQQQAHQTPGNAESTTPPEISAAPTRVSSGTTTPRPSVSSVLTETDASSLGSAAAATVSETHAQPSGGRDRRGARTRRMRPRTRRGASPDKWWRISDDKVRESETREVLDTQRDVYMLFYELVKTPAAPLLPGVNLAEKVAESIMTKPALVRTM